MRKQNNISHQIRTLAKDLDIVGSLSNQNTKTIAELLGRYRFYADNQFPFGY